MLQGCPSVFDDVSSPCCAASVAFRGSRTLFIPLTTRLGCVTDAETSRRPVVILEESRPFFSSHTLSLSLSLLSSPAY
jgi:hypothetical protein